MNCKAKVSVRLSPRGKHMETRFACRADIEERSPQMFGKYAYLWVGYISVFYLRQENTSAANIDVPMQARCARFLSITACLTRCKSTISRRERPAASGWCSCSKEVFCAKD